MFQLQKDSHTYFDRRFTITYDSSLFYLFIYSWIMIFFIKIFKIVLRLFFSHDLSMVFKEYHDLLIFLVYFFW